MPSSSSVSSSSVSYSSDSSLESSTSLQSSSSPCSSGSLNSSSSLQSSSSISSFCSVDDATLERTPGIVEQEATGDGAWNDPDNASAEDGLETLAVLGSGITNDLICRDFGFHVPIDAALSGIEVRIKKRKTGTTVTDLKVQLEKPDGVLSMNRARTTEEWPLVLTDTFYGGRCDLWDLDLNHNQLNSPDFKVRIAATLGSSAHIDVVTVIIYFDGGSSSISSSVSLSESSDGCDPFEFDLCGRNPIGVVQPPQFYGYEYPWVNPSADIHALVADAYLAYEDQSRVYELPFKVTYMYGFGCIPKGKPAGTPVTTHNADVVIKDANDLTVFDSTTASRFARKDWGDRLEIIEWESDLAVCRFVLHTAWPGESSQSLGLEPSPKNYPIHIVPDNAVFDERVTQKMADRVKSIRVGLTKVDLDVVLQAGFNTEIIPGDEVSIFGGRRQTPFTWNFTPGAGDGRFNSCNDDELFVRTINGVAPQDTGEFLLAGDQCYFVRQPTTLLPGTPRTVAPTPATLQVGNECEACCDCEDFENVYKAMIDIRDRWEAAGLESSTIRDDFEIFVEQWELERERREKFNWFFNMQTSDKRYIDIGAAFCNKGPDRCSNVEMQFEVIGAPEDFEIDECRSFASYQTAPCFTQYTPSIVDNKVSAFWSCADPLRSIALRTRLDMAPTAEDDPDFAAQSERNVGTGITVKMRVFQNGSLVANAELPMVRSITIAEC